VTEYQVGDPARLTLAVRDDTTGALIAADALPTCVVTDPAGGTSNATVTNPALGIYKIRHPLTAAGTWHPVWSWVVGGVAETDEKTIYAASLTDVALDPQPWAPTLRDVGSLIPTRTREVGVADDYVGTFTALTTPTDEAAQRILDACVARTIGCTGLPVVPVAYALAQHAAALRAAYLIELGFPERSADVQVYQELKVQADEACRDAGALNRGSGGGGSTTPDPDTLPTLVPAWSFPAAPAWKDSLSPTL
jgi:hypothetical protein